MKASVNFLKISQCSNFVGFFCFVLFRFVLLFDAPLVVLYVVY